MFNHVKVPESNMRLRAALLVVAALAAAAVATDYSVSFDGSTYTMYQDGAAQGSVTSNSSSITFSGVGDGGVVNVVTSYVTFTTSVSLNLTLVSASLVSSTSGYLLGNSGTVGVFRSYSVNATNNAVYFDNASVNSVNCGPFVDYSYGAASCNLLVGSAAFVDTYTTIGVSPRRINFTVTGGTTAQISSLMTIALARLHSNEQQSSTAGIISSAMSSRGSSLKTFAGVLYVTIILELTLLSLVAAYFVALIPLDFFRKKYAMLVNFIALLVLGIILCAAAGLIGYFTIQALLLVIVIIAPICKCFCCKNPDHDPWGGSTTRDDATFCEKITNWRTIILIVASVILLFDIIWLFADNIPAYQVFSRPDGSAITEYQPYLIVKSLSAVYAYKNIAQNPLQVNKLFQVATTACGTEFTTTLSDSQKKSSLYDSWIAKYSVNMTLFVPSDYTKYNSVNDWFIRNINMTFRPIAFSNDATVITSPADSRTVGFENVGTDQEIWLKGDKFTVSQLVNGDAIYSEFANGSSLVISRLSPQDYHRFHAPATGTLRKFIHITGQYQSVNADAVSSGNEVLVNNVRTAAVLDVPINGKNTTVLYVAVGANCVGSVKFTVTEGSSFNKGDNIGYFQFGGSTVVTIFQKNHVRLSDDIQRNSFKDVETYVNVGDIIATLM
eukprot:TRINITY_DN1811_c0_g1_i1.p1 TRINITY_DN1811_c0_g1~~TRINITY_DN1811_c0_g1_i1.p1  ORF type:complete len:668 (-),score=135.87 TRINITY_DN1811_c0_g1_i1:1175-3178(-)